MKSIACIFAVLSSVVLAGCGSSETEADDHAHHEFPEHRPPNFKAAVSAVSQRSWELANRGGKIGSLEFGHFVDIINWIPELAADSDLKKSDWEAARDASLKMRSKVLSRDLDIKQLEDVVSDELAILTPLIQKAGTPEPDLYHHDHHHHDH
ncbi:MAG: hypothetical protein AB8G99_25315 [Planctomycetaceae bacterium]